MTLTVRHRYYLSIFRAKTEYKSQWSRLQCTIQVWCKYNGS